MITRISMLLTLALAAVMFTPSLEAGSSAKDASILLQRIEANAFDVREHAARLKTYNRFPGQHSWQIHTFELQRIKERMSDIAKLVGEFKHIKDDASERQNKAYNYVVPESVKVSELTEKALRIADNQEEKLEVAHPDYAKTIDQIYDRADQIVAAIGLAESWQEVKEARKQLTQK